MPQNAPTTKTAVAIASTAEQFSAALLAATKSSIETIEESYNFAYKKRETAATVARTAVAAIVERTCVDGANLDASAPQTHATKARARYVAPSPIYTLSNLAALDELIFNRLRE